MMRELNTAGARATQRASLRRDQQEEENCHAEDEHTGKPFWKDLGIHT